MKKDLQSYRIHNETYEKETDFYSKDAIMKRTEKTKDFERTGFELALMLTKNIPETHIDIGCGVGWLIRKLQPYFKYSIGIEPSEAALSSAKELMKGYSSVSFLNCDMVDGITSLNLQKPVFFTTGAVLSHIENFYVIDFLNLLDKAPKGSVLFFSENYDRNIDWTMWHIRNKEWWRKHLPGWQLIFFDIENGGYASGIYGLKIEKEKILSAYTRDLLWLSYWNIDRFKNITERVLKKILRIITNS